MSGHSGSGQVSLPVSMSRVSAALARPKAVERFRRAVAFRATRHRRNHPQGAQNRQRARTQFGVRQLIQPGGGLRKANDVRDLIGFWPSAMAWAMPCNSGPWRRLRTTAKASAVWASPLCHSQKPAHAARDGVSSRDSTGKRDFQRFATQKGDKNSPSIATCRSDSTSWPNRNGSNSSHMAGPPSLRRVPANRSPANAPRPH